MRPLFLSLVETYIVQVHPSALQPALKAIILALLPGLEEETSEDFERVLTLLDKIKGAVNEEHKDQSSSEPETEGKYFWQCFFLASIGTSNRRHGVLAFLVRRLPRLRSSSAEKPTSMANSSDVECKKRKGLHLRSKQSCIRNPACSSDALPLDSLIISC